MKKGEKGFTIVELLVASAIIAIISGAAATTTFQIAKSTEPTNNHMTAVCQVQNAGYRICRDAQMAESVAVDNLEHPNFLILTWTEQNYDGSDPTYHSVTYFFTDLSDGIGKLKRNHWSSAGANEDTLVAKHIYYNLDDPETTSKASYESPVLTIQLTALSEEARETREYRITHRPNFGS
ncbi:prepilin-type N-terminal cleavage/methylation domain-containing protein [Chloroflexota bacterium]